VTIAFNEESFRGDYTFRNSAQAIRRFPFPLTGDAFTYSMNLEPHGRGARGTVFENRFDVDEHYVAETRERALVLGEDPLRCQSLPHMALAEWDLLEHLMTALAEDHPSLFSLECDGNRWHWRNRPLGIEQAFTFLDDTTLPCPPLEYITRQMQGDFCLLDQRDNTLWLDAGMVTSQSDWSLDFNLGMDFMEFHGPVPMAHESGVFDRALKFLLALRQGAPVRRLNWSMTVNPRLDLSSEAYPEWAAEKRTLTPENIGRKQHLRVELQTLFRLPRSNAIAFQIRCYLCSFADIVTVPKWGRRLHRVLRDLPEELTEYKGLTGNRTLLLDYLAQFDDGLPTSPGIAPEIESEPPLQPRP
jgi:hypothetical protein